MQRRADRIAGYGVILLTIVTFQDIWTKVCGISSGALAYIVRLSLPLAHDGRHLAPGRACISGKATAAKTSLGDPMHPSRSPDQRQRQTEPATGRWDTSYGAARPPAEVELCGGVAADDVDHVAAGTRWLACADQRAHRTCRAAPHCGSADMTRMRHARRNLNRREGIRFRGAGVASHRGPDY